MSRPDLSRSEASFLENKVSSALLWRRQGHRGHSPRGKESRPTSSASPCLARVEVSLRILGDPRSDPGETKALRQKVASRLEPEEGIPWGPCEPRAPGPLTCLRSRCTMGAGLFSHPCDEETQPRKVLENTHPYPPSIPPPLLMEPEVAPSGRPSFQKGRGMQTTQELHSHFVNLVASTPNLVIQEGSSGWGDAVGLEPGHVVPPFSDCV